MYDDGHQAEASQLADDISKELGKTDVQKISGSVKSEIGGASVVIVIGQDDSEL